jgi:hypothetical protein
MQELRGTENEPDFLPVVKLFMPECGFVWLLTEVDPEQPDIAFGLSDLGMGCPELDSVSLSEIELAAEVRGSPSGAIRLYSREEHLGLCR